MSAIPGKTVLITGANAGIGKDVARQLALRPEMGRIYLACRNKDRAITAKAELESATGRRIFEIVLMDVADRGSVRSGLAAIDGSVAEPPYRRRSPRRPAASGTSPAIVCGPKRC
jgi:NAD(P)-dependent dehydrogenase (short-subunit alcohol dehydrogenase family)